MQDICISNCGIQVTSRQDRYKCIDTMARNFRRSEIEMKSDRERRQGRGSSFRSSALFIVDHPRSPVSRGFRVSRSSSSSTTDLARSLSREHARMPCNLHPEWRRSTEWHISFKRARIEKQKRYLFNLPQLGDCTIYFTSPCKRSGTDVNATK